MTSYVKFMCFCPLWLSIHQIISRHDSNRQKDRTSHLVPPWMFRVESKCKELSLNLFQLLMVKSLCTQCVSDVLTLLIFILWGNAYRNVDFLPLKSLKSCKLEAVFKLEGKWTTELRPATPEGERGNVWLLL